MPETRPPSVAATLRDIVVGTPTEGPPRLILRFAVLAALALAVGAATVLLIVRHLDTQRAESTAIAQARFVATALGADFLKAEDFQAPLGERRRTRLLRRLTPLREQHTVRVEFYSRDGHVTFSTDPRRIGQRSGNAHLIEEAFAGSSVSHVTELAQRRADSLRALATYVPMAFDSRRADGVVAIAQDYAPIAASARAAFLPIAAVFEIALVVLFIGLVPMLRRVTRRIRSQMWQLERKAYYDELTGLPNRTLFDAAIRHALGTARVGNLPLAVMLMDLDGFKDVNDTLGHQSGDILLEEVGRRLEQALGDDGVVARLGGDEFGLVVPLSGETTVETVTQRLRHGLERPYVLRGLPIRVTGSIGVASYPEHGADPVTLVKHADVALYQAKESHIPYALYSAERDTNDAGRLALVAELRTAIDRGEIVLLYQPQADLRTGKVIGVEALVRWRHPLRGLLSPAEFVPLAERTGLIKPLSRYVLAQAVEQAAIWARDGLEIGVAVNLTMPDLLDLELPRDLGVLLAEAGLDPGRLELEITESTIMADPDRVQSVLDEIHAMGIGLSIDDFGTGYSSLAYLKRLPARKLKIDKSFVFAMTADASDATIVRSTIELGHNLGLTVVAEGVETTEMWQALQRHGCDVAQGFLVGRPMYAETVVDLLRSRGTKAGDSEEQPADDERPPRHLAAVG